MYRRVIKNSIRVSLLGVLVLILFIMLTTPAGNSTTETPSLIITPETTPTTALEPITEVEVPTTEETVMLKETEPTEVATTPQETTVPTEPIPEETEFVSYYSYTEEELDLLARLVYSESGAESYDTKLRVASVVMNRVEDSYFPDNIYDVIYQKGQFSVTTIKIDGVIMIDRPADEESYRAAKEILDYGSILPSTVQVFYAYYCTESWVTSREVYERCDDTIFSHIYS